MTDVLDQFAPRNGGMPRPQDLMSAFKSKTEKRETAFADLVQAGR